MTSPDEHHGGPDPDAGSERDAGPEPDAGSERNAGSERDRGASPGGVVVDARERRCPIPVIMLARAAAAAPPGTRIRVLSTDPAAGGDIAAWCRMRGHRLLSSTPAGDHLVSEVDLG